MNARLNPELRTAFSRAALDWMDTGKTARLWAKDATLWTGRDEAGWLGWLDAPEREAARLASYAELARVAARKGVRDVLLLGMGGSSLGAEVLRRSYGEIAGAPRLHVLDSTHPDQVRDFAERIDPRTAWVVVASKSGSTVEPNLLLSFFLDRFAAQLGGDAAARFIAISDPGSSLDKLAREKRFLALVPGEPSIGGRFSALSPFGLVPAALLGIELPRYVERAAELAAACHEPEVLENPGVALGLALGVAAASGRDKLTLLLAPEIAALGAWLEQLVAESTGKLGKVILPVDGELLAPSNWYGRDRLFVAVRYAGRLSPEQEVTQAELLRAGLPVVGLDCADLAALGAEFFRWEVATAVAGAYLGLHPFDQPDVEAAKIAARRLTRQVEESGALPPESPFYAEHGVELFADPEEAAALFLASDERSLKGLFAAHLDRARPGDYVALCAFLEMSAENEAALTELRNAIARLTGVATTLGFGPRFLHSTGQAHKGGPPSGLFLQFTDKPAADLQIPGQRLTFGQVIAAQARGDFQVLSERGRRALRIHFAMGAEKGLKRVLGAIGFSKSVPSAN
jgi:transaldolase/glucose-6-phosphate isomerase